MSAAYTSRGTPPVDRDFLQILQRQKDMESDLVRVRVLRPFCIAGKPVAVGEVVKVPRYLANDLQAQGRAELARGLFK